MFTSKTGEPPDSFFLSHPTSTDPVGCASEYTQGPTPPHHLHHYDSVRPSPGSWQWPLNVSPYFESCSSLLFLRMATRVNLLKGRMDCGHSTAQNLQRSQLTLGENQHPYNGLQGPPTPAHLFSYQQVSDLIIPIAPGSYPPATGLLEGPVVLWATEASVPSA